jgi:hypothetical protein
LSFIESADTKADLLPVVFDTSKVFGTDTSLNSATAFFSSSSSVEDILSKPQYGWARTSSAFPALSQVTLGPGENITIASVYGKAENINLVPKIADTGMGGDEAR